ncbi:MAG: 50S ribosomal protein L9 [Dehalococcoidia bacterium]
MKVVLIQEVENLGIAGDIKDVKSGYARNYLLPEELAVLATPQELAAAGARRERELVRRQQLNEEMESVAASLIDQLLMPVKVGGAGQLYGSVSVADIAESISNLVGADIDRKAINLSGPIREQGHHEISVRFAPDVFAEITVTVFDDSMDPVPGLDFKFEDEEEEEEPTFQGAIAQIEAEENEAEESETPSENLPDQIVDDETIKSESEEDSEDESNSTDETEESEN